MTPQTFDVINNTIAKNWVEGNCPTVLHQIHSNEVNIATYNREIDVLSNEIDTALNQAIEIRVNGDIDKIVQTIENNLKEFDLLKSDLISLLHLFKDITKANRYKVLLATVNTNMCRRFHTDINDLRMLCTYSGPGTLWLEDDNVNRKALVVTVNTNMCRRFHTDINDLRMLCTYSGPGTLWLEDDNVNRKALDTCGDNECIVLDETKIHQAKTGSVVILKGAIYPTEGTKAIVHRSPTIEEIGERRLLLRIDTNEFLNFD